jgi:hypothetical protein
VSLTNEGHGLGIEQVPVQDSNDQRFLLARTPPVAARLGSSRLATTHHDKLEE